jgi:hypothetical protein
MVGAVENEILRARVDDTVITEDKGFCVLHISAASAIGRQDINEFEAV